MLLAKLEHFIKTLHMRKILVYIKDSSPWPGCVIQSKRVNNQLETWDGRQRKWKMTKP